MTRELVAQAAVLGETAKNNIKEVQKIIDRETKRLQAIRGFLNQIKKMKLPLNFTHTKINLQTDFK